MRALIAALLLTCSVAQAGTYSISVTDPSLVLRDLDPSDGITPALTLFYGTSVADWNKPLVCSGEFWSDYTDMKSCPAVSLYGTLSAHSAIDWNGTVTIDVHLLPVTATQSENVALYGGGSGYTNAATHSEFEINPYVRSTDSHESFAASLFLANDTDGPANFEMHLGFEAFQQSSDYPRPVPEPSTYLLMLGGLAALPLLRRKRAQGRVR
ncbi:PEP-CTERM sorting domain-containing protein [Piscinibacter terrae]|nr:PEP-CTERM sorting domain-containing protein [Albitalea terrae]